MIYSLPSEKMNIFLMMLLALYSCSDEKIVPVSANFPNNIEVPLGGNTFQVSGEKKETINENGISSWENSDSVFETYIYFQTAKTVSLSLNLNNLSFNSKIAVTIGSETKEATILPNQAKVEIGSFNFKEGYEKISLKGIQKQGIHFALIKSINIAFEGNLGLDFVKDNIENRFYWGRRGPSVHLSYDLPSGKAFKWFYNEMMIPSGQDPIGSYFMANGFGEGYFGIQVNSNQERRILFSVWSPFQTDNPNDIPEDQKIKLVKKGVNVYTGEFGNEGSGGQSYLIYDWQADQTYRFLNSVEPDGKGNTIYTAYFMDPSVGKWILIASFLRPNTNTWYNSPHSFLENFDQSMGHKKRSVNYQNQWVADSAGEFTELNIATLTGDDIAQRKYRIDFGGGIRDGGFFLQNGGFFNPFVGLNSKFTRQKTTSSPNIEFDKLP